MHTPLTQHARTRMQQRGIAAVAVDLLMDYGREAHDHRGCRILCFDKRSRRRVARELKAELFRRVERYLGTYAVLAEDGAVVTVGHRVTRLPR